MLKFFRRQHSSPSSATAPRSEELPLTDGEIEAEYFPGTSAVAPSQITFDLAGLRSCPAEPQWAVEGTGGVELLVAGTPESPDAKSVLAAQAVLADLTEITSVAIQVARAFMRDEGTWSLCEVNLSSGARKNECDFQIGLSFSPADGTDKYGYVAFSVCFCFNQLPGAGRRYHQSKFVVELL